MPQVFPLPKELVSASQAEREAFVLRRLTSFYDPETGMAAGKLIATAWDWADAREWPAPRGAWDIVVVGLMKAKEVQVWGVLGRARCDHRRLSVIPWKELLPPSLLHSLCLLESDWPERMRRREP